VRALLLSVVTSYLFLAPGVSRLLATPVLLVADSTQDRVVRLEDRNGSGTVEADVVGEVTVFYDDSSPGPDLSVPSHLAVGSAGQVYLLDGGTVDAVLCLSDVTGDLDANDDGGEVVVFYDNSNPELPEIFTANTLVAAPDGVFYLSDDGSAARRVLRFTDLNHDGDASDPGESVVVYDGSALSSPFLEDIESLVVMPSGHLLAGDSTLEGVYSLVDRNDDGNFNGADEVGLFYRGDGETRLSDLDALVVVDAVVYALSEDTGTILWLEDRNGDGDAMGEGEHGVFLDGSTTPSVADINDLVPDPAGGFFLADGRQDTVYRAVDLNGDRDVLDEKELERYIVGDAGLSTPSAIVVLPTKANPGGRLFIRGDADGSGEIDVSDAIAILGYLFLGEEPGSCLDARDVNDNGVVDVTDPVYGLNHQFLGGAPPPPPFPQSGSDPTDDELDC
jgi:hypothetical protein